MRVLAIDPGTYGFGWACGDVEDGKPPSFGTYQPVQAGLDLGLLMRDVRQFLWRWMDPVREVPLIDFVAYEAPVVVRSNNVMTLRKMFAMGALIEMMAHDARIEVGEIEPGPVRKHFLGKGNTPRKSPEIKQAIMRQCKIMGWKVCTDHEADALALLTYVQDVRGSRLRMMIREQA